MPRVDEATMKRQITAHWDARAPLLDVPAWHVAKSEREDAAWRATLARHLPARSGLAVLDIGTGLGYLAGVAAALGHRAAGIDIAPKMIERAGERAASLGLTMDLRVADVDALPFEDGTFDAVTERNVLWTMPDPARTLAELRRVLRPGGHLLVMESRWLERDDAPAPVPAGGAPSLDEHYREFRADLPLMGGRAWEEMATVLDAAGFIEIERDPLDEVYAARVAYDAAMAQADDRRMYLLRARAPGQPSEGTEEE